MCRMVQIRQGLGTSHLFVTANPSDVALPTQSGSQEVSLVTRVSGFPSAPGSTFRQLSPWQWSSHMGLSWACLGAGDRMWILVMKILKLFAQELRGLFFIEIERDVYDLAFLGKGSWTLGAGKDAVWEGGQTGKVGRLWGLTHSVIWLQEQAWMKYQLKHTVTNGDS